MATASGVDKKAIWSKKYSDGANLYFSTLVNYGTGQAERGLNPSQVDTYLMYERPRGLATQWVTAAKLGIDGKWVPLKESESFTFVGEDYKTLVPTGSTDDNYILGEAARKDLSAGGTTSLRYQAINNSKALLQSVSGVSKAEVDRAYDINNNITAPGQSPTPSIVGAPVTADQATEAPTPATGGATEENFSETENEIKKGVGEGTRESYNGTSILKYPENLQLEHQDCIKFSIFKYEPRGLSLAENRERRRLNKKTPIGTIVLPVPAGISDSNNADWQKEDLDLATAGISDFITQFVSKGKDAGVASAKETLGALSETDSKTLASIVAVKTAQAVTNTNVLSRAYGQVLNPNSELLFTGPSLRNFSFSFRLSPRSESEAVIVRTIIRYFKQAMSVQRSQSILLLRAPNTFGIEYLTSGQNAHPYLNKFKECALTQCNVNYTPDGQYMTYAGEQPSMTSYELQLQFQELEPIFNDDYTNADNGKVDSNIGY